MFVCIYTILVVHQVHVTYLEFITNLKIFTCYLLHRWWHFVFNLLLYGTGDEALFVFKAVAYNSRIEGWRSFTFELFPLCWLNFSIYTLIWSHHILHVIFGLHFEFNFVRHTISRQSYVRIVYTIQFMSSSAATLIVVQKIWAAKR